MNTCLKAIFCSLVLLLISSISNAQDNDGNTVTIVYSGDIHGKLLPGKA